MTSENPENPTTSNLIPSSNESWGLDFEIAPKSALSLDSQKKNILSDPHKSPTHSDLLTTSNIAFENAQQISDFFDSPSSTIGEKQVHRNMDISTTTNLLPSPEKDSFMISPISSRFDDFDSFNPNTEIDSSMNMTTMGKENDPTCPNHLKSPLNGDNFSTNSKNIQDMSLVNPFDSTETETPQPSLSLNNPQELITPKKTPDEKNHIQLLEMSISKLKMEHSMQLDAMNIEVHVALENNKTLESENLKQKNDLAEFVDRIGQMQEKLDKLENENEQSSQTNKVYISEKETLQSTIKSLEQSLAEETNNNAKLLSEFDTAVVNLNLADQRFNRLNTDFNVLAGAKMKLEENIDSERGNLVAQIENLNHTISTLKLSVEKLTNENNLLQIRIQGLEKINLSVTQERDQEKLQMQSIISRLENKNTQLSQELSVVITQKNESETMIDVQKADNELLRDTNSQLINELTILENVQKTAQTEFSNVQNQLKVKTQEISSLNSQIDSYKTKITEMNVEFQDIEGDLNQKLKDLASQLDSQIVMTNSAHLQASSLKSKLLTSQESLESAQEQSTVLQEELAKSNESNVIMSSQIEKFEATQQSLIPLVEKMKSSIESLVSENSRLVSEVDSLIEASFQSNLYQKENATLNLEISSLNSQIATLKQNQILEIEDKTQEAIQIYTNSIKKLSTQITLQKESTDNDLKIILDDLKQFSENSKVSKELRDQRLYLRDTVASKLQNSLNTVNSKLAEKNSDTISSSWTTCLQFLNSMENDSDYYASRDEMDVYCGYQNQSSISHTESFMFMPPVAVPFSLLTWSQQTIANLETDLDAADDIRSQLDGLIGSYRSAFHNISSKRKDYLNVDYNYFTFENENENEKGQSKKSHTQKLFKSTGISRNLNKALDFLNDGEKDGELTVENKIKKTKKSHREPGYLEIVYSLCTIMKEDVEDKQKTIESLLTEKESAERKLTREWRDEITALKTNHLEELDTLQRELVYEKKTLSDKVSSLETLSSDQKAKISTLLENLEYLENVNSQLSGILDKFEQSLPELQPLKRSKSNSFDAKIQNRISNILQEYDNKTLELEKNTQFLTIKDNKLNHCISELRELKLQKDQLETQLTESINLCKSLRCQVTDLQKVKREFACTQETFVDEKELISSKVKEQDAIISVLREKISSLECLALASSQSSANRIIGENENSLESQLGNNNQGDNQIGITPPTNLEANLETALGRVTKYREKIFKLQKDVKKRNVVIKALRTKLVQVVKREKEQKAKFALLHLNSANDSENRAFISKTRSQKAKILSRQSRSSLSGSVLGENENNNTNKSSSKFDHFGLHLKSNPKSISLKRSATTTPGMGFFPLLEKSQLDREQTNHSLIGIENGAFGGGQEQMDISQNRIKPSSSNSQNFQFNPLTVFQTQENDTQRDENENSMIFEDFNSFEKTDNINSVNHPQTDDADDLLDEDSFGLVTDSINSITMRSKRRRELF